jgi:hypothetical protein
LKFRVFAAPATANDDGLQVIGVCTPIRDVGALKFLEKPQPVDTSRSAVGYSLTHRSTVDRMLRMRHRNGSTHAFEISCKANHLQRSRRVCAIELSNDAPRSSLCWCVGVPRRMIEGL